MDFRLDKISWVFLAVIFGTFFYFLGQGAGWDTGFLNLFKMGAFALLCTVLLVALMSIPVVIVCYFIKRIPDIDYSILGSFIVTIIGIISELIF